MGSMTLEPSAIHIRTSAKPPPKGGTMDSAEITRRSFAWIVAPFIAVFVVAGASSVNLDRASVALRALAVVGLFTGSCVLAITPGVALLSLMARYRFPRAERTVRPPGRTAPSRPVVATVVGTSRRANVHRDCLLAGRYRRRGMAHRRCSLLAGVR